jgi:2-keto-4-pentenoate hydratase/2-oxohepta-3-ene-1,7-dioic acid hydratase in catechol pathway
MKILCVGRNYADHAKELNNDIPSKPLIFMKPATAILKDDKPFYIPEFSNDLHYELELVVKIAKNGKYISKRFAQDYYDEISVGIDITARDLQAELKANGHPWEIAKAFDNSALLGKFISKATFDLSQLNFSLKKNNELVQQGNSKDMLFEIDDIIVYVSQFFRLQMGDLIYTGTPAGVGKMSIGDTFEGFIEEKKLFRTEIK